MENIFHKKPRFSFTGGGGGTIRGYPGMPIKKYIKELVKNVQKIKGCGKEFQKSSVRLINRSVDLLKKEKLLTNNYELSYYLYNRGPLIYHFGRASLKGFLRNWYSLQPLLDPDLKRINYDKKGKSPHDLISYIYMRFSPELIEFPIEGKRKLNVDSIIKAKNLIKMLPPYKKKFDYNDKFYIDLKRKSPVPPYPKSINVEKYLQKLVVSHKFIHIIEKIYDKKVYKWAQNYMNNSHHLPYRHNIGLLSIAKVLDYLYLNKKCYKKLKCKKILLKKLKFSFL